MAHTKPQGWSGTKCQPQLPLPPRPRAAFTAGTGRSKASFPCDECASESHTNKHVLKLTERTVNVSLFPQGRFCPQGREGWLPPQGSRGVSPFSWRPSPFVLVKSTLQTGFPLQAPVRGETCFESSPSTVPGCVSGCHWDGLCETRCRDSLSLAARTSFAPSRN